MTDSLTRLGGLILGLPLPETEAMLYSHLDSSLPSVQQMDLLVVKHLVAWEDRCVCATLQTMC